MIVALDKDTEAARKKLMEQRRKEKERKHKKLLKDKMR